MPEGNRHVPLFVNVYLSVISVLQASTESVNTSGVCKEHILIVVYHKHVF